MTSYAPERHHRRSLRLRGYDYTQGGLYFVTICTHAKACIFGEIVDGTVHLSASGQIVAEEWERTAELRPQVALDAFIVMPNHPHGILTLIDVDAAGRALPIQQSRMAGVTPPGPTAGSVSAIIGQFKAASARRINAVRHTPGTAVWQRNFHDHIIRHDRALEQIRAYIADNPAIWEADQLHMPS
jgi:REP element-mobilizing transposase RayT